MRVVLCSQSPRRRQLLAGLDIDFEVRTLEGMEEPRPEGLSPEETAMAIAEGKAAAFNPLNDDEVILTADTIVACSGEILGKPATAEEACGMLRTLSGKTHQVVTGVTLKSTACQRTFNVSTSVTFKRLSDEEINYYVNHYKPLDKAGAYGIQEWIGYIGVKRLEGSYFNVMGLPVQRIYEVLCDHFMASHSDH